MDYKIFVTAHKDDPMIGIIYILKDGKIIEKHENDPELIIIKEEVKQYAQDRTKDIPKSLMAEFKTVIELEETIKDAPQGPESVYGASEDASEDASEYNLPHYQFEVKSHEVVIYSDEISFKPEENPEPATSPQMS